LDGKLRSKDAFYYPNNTSTLGFKTNSDGSVHVYFGPKAP
jgi:hypothetical protein